MKKSLHVLCASTHRFPVRHSFLEEVMCRGLTARGHRVTWIFQTNDKQPTFEHKTWLGCSVWLLPSRQRTSFANRLFNFLKKPLDSSRIFKRIIQQHGVPDVIQVRNDWLMACWAIIMRRRYQSLVVFQYSFPIPQEHFERAKKAKGFSALLHATRGYLELVLLKFAMRNADHILPVSTSMKNSLTRSGVDPLKMTALPLGVTFEGGEEMESQNARKALGINSTDPVCIYFGSLSKFRNLNFLLEMMKIVEKKLPTAKLIVLGGNHLEIDSLRKRGIHLGLERSLIFHEKVEREVVPYFIRAANVGISAIPPIPMYIDSYPTKLIETLAAGRPVVGNDEIFEQELVIKESGGGLSVPYVAESFAQALVELLSKPGRARAMGASGLKYVREHNSYDKITGKLEDLYFQLRRERPIE